MVDSPPSTTKPRLLASVRVRTYSILGSVFLLLPACGGSKSSVDNPESASPEEKVLNVYNWATYMGRTTIADFEAKSGIKVNFDTFESVEMLETKMLTGSTGYDVVFPGSTYLERLMKAGVFRKLDRAALPNLVNLDPKMMSEVALNDPGNEHAIAYLWGTTGVVYNPDMVERTAGLREIASWGVIFDPAVASKVAKCGLTFLDSPDDVFSAAEIYLGTNPANEDFQELRAAERLLMKVRPFVRQFDSRNHAASLASGDICISISWSGFALGAVRQAAEAAVPVTLKYVIPKEGATVYFDVVAIPQDAPHPTNAHAFLNFLMEPQVIAKISNDLRYPNANKASVPLLDADLRDDPAIYVDEETWKRLHPSIAYTQAYSREMNRAWTRVKTGQ
jgi:putrescine transport system substrate-binding protein